MLKEKIFNDLKQAMLAKKSEEIAVLRFFLSIVQNKEMEKRVKIYAPDKTEAELHKEFQLTEDELIGALQSEIKKNNDALAQFIQGGRNDLVEKTKKEIAILQRYLPPQLSEEEIKEIIKEAIKKNKIREIKDLGKIMKEVMPKLKGKADGGLINKIAREMLEHQ